MKPSRVQQQEVQRSGNELEAICTDYMTKQKATPELAIGAIAGLSNVIVCTAFALWGPEFGLECITKAVNSAAEAWKKKEEEENETRKRTETKDSGETRS